MSVKHKRLRLAIVTLAIICLSSITVFAVSKLLTAKEAASLLTGSTEPSIAAAFDSKDAIVVNKSITKDNYTVTFLGITSEKSLGSMVDDAKSAERSYAVVAIENANGTAMGSDPSEQFLVTPLIKGLNPAMFNIFTLNGSFSERVIDGIRYRMIACDSIEMFADKGLYLSVTATSFYESSAYLLNNETGELTPNPDYTGLNALFTLPLDTSKADPEKAAAYVADILAPKNDSQEDSSTEKKPDDIADIIKNFTPIESSKQILKPDENGNYAYSYSAKDGAGITSQIDKNTFEAKKAGEPFLYSTSESSDEKTTTTWSLVLTYQENGNVEAIIYEDVKDVK